VERLIEDLTTGNVTEVKVVLATVVLSPSSDAVS
jgi:hypothetical protein